VSDLSKNIPDLLGLVMARIHKASSSHGDTVGEVVEGLDRACVELQDAIDRTKGGVLGVELAAGIVEAEAEAFARKDDVDEATAGEVTVFAGVAADAIRNAAPADAAGLMEVGRMELGQVLDTDEVGEVRKNARAFAAWLAAWLGEVGDHDELDPGNLPELADRFADAQAAEAF